MSISTRKSKVTIVAILPAYNAAKTLTSVIESLPAGVFSAVILSDDCSRDKTVEVAKKVKGVTVIQTPRNLGYGGNLKYSLSFAMEMGADIMVEIHPDGEYGADGILPALRAIQNGALLVLGNRLSSRINGMYWWKYLGTRLLTRFDNIALETNIPDLHQGFRVYTRKLLTTVDYRNTSNGYLFSFEIIVKAWFAGLPIGSVPVSASYKGKKRGAPTSASLRYVLGTLGVLYRYFIASLGFKVALFGKNNDKIPSCPSCRVNWLSVLHFKQDKWKLYHCGICTNDYLAPISGSVSRQYRQSYYLSNTVAGKVKNFVYNYFQSRRMRWVQRYFSGGLVLDVGSGEGNFGKNIGKNFTVVDIEAPFAHIVNSQVVKTDFLSWNTKKRFDCAVFWQSLEHVPDPKAYIEHARDLLKKHGYIFVEFPRFSSFESRLFGKHWYHLDLPRHISQFSDSGLAHLFTSSSFTIVETHSVVALEYQIIGGAANLMNAHADELAPHMRSLWFWVRFIPALFVSCLMEGIFIIVGQSPIGMIVARKK